MLYMDHHTMRTASSEMARLYMATGRAVVDAVRRQWIDAQGATQQP